MPSDTKPASAGARLLLKRVIDVLEDAPGHNDEDAARLIDAEFQPVIDAMFDAKAIIPQ